MNSKEKSKQFEKEKVFRHLQSVQEFEKEIQVLRKENQELKDDLKRCQYTIKKWINDNKQLIIDNGKMKKALDILINKKVYIYGIKSFSSVMQYNNIIIGTEFDKLTQEEYKLLKKEI